MVALPVPKEHIVEPLRQALRPLRIVLFGSFARGTAGPDSDLDLLVVCPDGADRQAARIDALVALHALGWAKDVVVTTPSHICWSQTRRNAIVNEALREGIHLYGAP